MGGGLNLHPWNAFVSSLPWRLILDTHAPGAERDINAVGYSSRSSST